uniref:Hsp70 family protein n=1 Tax=Vibrio cholerae TaxID=666 RepID=UPI003F585EF1
MVNYGADATRVGYPAREQAETDPHNTVISVKRLLGRSLQDINQRYPHLPYRFKASEKGLPIVQTAQGDKNPIQISADILKALAERATATLGGELAEWSSRYLRISMMRSGLPPKMLRR